MCLTSRHIFKTTTRQAEREDMGMKLKTKIPSIKFQECRNNHQVIQNPEDIRNEGKPDRYTIREYRNHETFDLSNLWTVDFQFL